MRAQSPAAFIARTPGYGSRTGRCLKLVIKTSAASNAGFDPVRQHAEELRASKEFNAHNLPVFPARRTGFRPVAIEPIRL